MPLVALPEPEDWLLVAPWDIDDDGLVVVVCWSALAPLVTLCEPLPMFTPGLTSAPTLALELFTPTFASTPTFGFTLRLFDDVPLVPLEDPDALGVDDCDVEELDGLLEELDGLLEELELLLEELDGLLEELEPFALMSVELELEDGLEDCDPLRFTSILFELDELDEGDCAEPLPFRLMSVELDELDGACEAAPAPFKWMSVEFDELEPGVPTLADPFTPLSISVREDEVPPGTTATPGPTSVVVVLVLPDRASGTLGMQPAGCVFAGSMHFGAPDGRSTVYLSACATPKAASIEAARRLIVKLFRFISFPPRD